MFWYAAPSNGGTHYFFFYACVAISWLPPEDLSINANTVWFYIKSRDYVLLYTVIYIFTDSYTFNKVQSECVVILP